MTSPVKAGIRHVKPILSLTHGEARRRVITLYKTWYRQIPFIIANYNLSKTEAECKRKLKEEFMRYAHVRDVRVVDVLYIKGQMQLQEVVLQWIPTATLLNYWRESWEPKPKDFMSKFLSGHD